QVQTGLTWGGVRWAFTTNHAGNWHPFTWLSLMLDRTVFGEGAFGFHLTNVLLHAANMAMLPLLLSRMTGDIWRSALVAAIAAVHPLRVESVAWIAERKDVLGFFFGFLTLHAYVSYARSPSAIRYALLAAAFAACLLAKSFLVTLPCLLLLLDYWPLGRVRFGDGAALDNRFRPPGLTWLILEKAPLLALSACASAATIHAQSAGHALADIGELPLSVRLANAVVAYG